MSKQAMDKVMDNVNAASADSETAELNIRSVLVSALERWLTITSMTPRDVAALLGVTQARVEALRRGQASALSLNMLIRLAARAGLQPQLRVAT